MKILMLRVPQKKAFEFFLCRCLLEEKRKSELKSVFFFFFLGGRMVGFRSLGTILMMPMVTAKLCA